MPVLMRAAGVFAVVQMQRLQPVKADHAVEFSQHAVQIVYNVVSRVRHGTYRAHAEQLPHRQASRIARSSSNRPPTSLRLPDIVSSRTVVCCSAGRPHPDTRRSARSFNALSNMAAGMEIVSFRVSARRCKSLSKRPRGQIPASARPLGTGSYVRRMGHDAAQLPVLLHLHEHGGVRRVSTFCSTAARVARKLKVFAYEEAPILPSRHSPSTRTNGSPDTTPSGLLQAYFL